ncbi:MAG: glutamate synthase large subunit [Oligosphaeraceae bacterium]|nr:glutamate synthase large subunit [Oligosphaeraceae bacterium]
MGQQIYVPDSCGLYAPEQEHDACGVGLVADINACSSHRIIEQGIRILCRLMHRGAAGSDPDTGDGAGLLLAIPDAFLRSVLDFTLPAKGCYGVAMLFGGLGCEAAIESIIRSEGAAIIGWREVPVRPEFIGQIARKSAPTVRQIFIDGSGWSEQSAFERKLFVMRRLIEKAGLDLYICSMSSRSIVYKGLLLATQLAKFYPDLEDARFTSPLALVHQRYSTNTFPTWNLAHPFRYLAHNGEINTLRGNLNALKAREQKLRSPLLGEDLAKLLPLTVAGQSDSACLDNMFELLVAAGRPLEHAMLMLLPQAWGDKYYMGRDVRGFFEYHSALMEPWDGPAAVAFSDGVNAGAILDRNGLRPARYTLCKDGLFVLASEAGVLDLAPGDVLQNGRLKPGEMIYLDLEQHRVIPDTELKNRLARSQPYRRWVEENRVSVNGLFTEITASEPSADLQRRQLFFGYTREDLERILQPMAESGQEPTGSMGNDAALAVLSRQPQLLFNYFKQLFAQVTNPPIDPIREELVMSLMTYIGNQANIFAETPEHARLIKLRRPVLTDAELNRLEQAGMDGYASAVLKCGFPQGADDAMLRQVLQDLAAQAVAAVRSGHRIIVLSDRNLAGHETAIPSLLSLSAVNRSLLESGLRPEVGVIIQSGEVREVMHFALLLGYGATAINPYLALESVTALARSGKLNCPPLAAASNYIHAIDKGLLKIMSKLGISTLRSYRSAQSFEAVGLHREFIAEFLPGTASRIGGIGLAEIAQEAHARSARAQSSSTLPAGGQYQYTRDGEAHLWTPSTLAKLRTAVRSADYAAFKEYSSRIDNQAENLCTLRGLFAFAPTTAIPLEAVESAENIMRCFMAGAMSLGSLSPEAHQAIACALNRCGAMSNCGEGGENSDRFDSEFNSAIKQVSSGRFGVSINYLRHSQDIQIKIAQGAKPGEGGQLPGHKIDTFIAQLRHSRPKVTLISPPPHHDIYSIEDLAQLIFDLRCANPKARISVKLVSELGVGTVAAGVAKAHADVVLISGHDGGTGASPLTSIKHAGLPWELGLAETQQTLVLNRLRNRIRLQVDGQLKTGRDVIIGALLGAEEFGFGTALLVCLGCVMMRQCHSNTCPVGVATQDPALRQRFTGKPEYIEQFLRFVAQETREHLAVLGLHSLAEACGRTDLLQMNRAIDFYKAKNLDCSRIFAPAPAGPRRSDSSIPKEPLHNFDRRELLPKLRLDGRRETLWVSITNRDRAIATELSGEIVDRYGEKGLPEDCISINCEGIAGQSFGAFLAPGITLRLSGAANDFVGKGLSGGKIVLCIPKEARFRAEENVIAGNVIGYGGTAGKIFSNGLVGERFGIRNSGMTLVAEGVGDHGCEYMTGGRVVVLGKVGVNFAAGMTGGLAYVYDEAGDFDLSCNIEGIDLESVEPGSQSEAELRSLIEEHLHETSSEKALRILHDWDCHRPKFVRIFPVEYRQALAAK